MCLLVVVDDDDAVDVLWDVILPHTPGFVYLFSLIL